MSIERSRFNIENVEGDKPEEENITCKELSFEKTRPTLRGIEEVGRALGLGKEEFKNKTVLDIGSGFGGLALDLVNLPELKTQIVSLDPRYTKESLNKSLIELQDKCEKEGVDPPKNEQGLADLKKELKITSPVALFEAASELKKRKQAMVAGFAELLPFRDESFDMVVSTYAIPVGIEDSPKRIQKAIQEIERVLKINGEAYLGPVSNELKGLISSFSPPSSDIERRFRGSKITAEEANKYGMEAKWVLILRKLKEEETNS